MARIFALRTVCTEVIDIVVVIILKGVYIDKKAEGPREGQINLREKKYHVLSVSFALGTELKALHVSFISFNSHNMPIRVGIT